LDGNNRNFFNILRAYILNQIHELRDHPVCIYRDFQQTPEFVDRIPPSPINILKIFPPQFSGKMMSAFAVQNWGAAVAFPTFKNRPGIDAYKRGT